MFSIKTLSSVGCYCLNQFDECVLSVLFSVHSVVKEEIVDDDAHLPCFNGRVVSWVIIVYL